MTQRFAILALAVAVVFGIAGKAHAETDASFYAAATVDVLVFRPLAAAATVVGVALFVPAAIVTAPNGQDGVNEAWELFVIAPADHVAKRPLGEF